MVTRQQVEHVARLARLHLASDEAERMTRDLNGILEHMVDLADVDVAGMDATDGVIDQPPPLRADRPGRTELAVPPDAIAPAWNDGFFTVPKLEAMIEPGADA